MRKSLIAVLVAAALVATSCSDYEGLTSRYECDKKLEQLVAQSNELQKNVERYVRYESADSNMHEQLVTEMSNLLSESRTFVAICSATNRE